MFSDGTGKSNSSRLMQDLLASVLVSDSFRTSDPMLLHTAVSLEASNIPSAARVCRASAKVIATYDPQSNSINCARSSEYPRFKETQKAILLHGLSAIRNFRLES
eukprot:scpid42071/ scgid34675/ 